MRKLIGLTLATAILSALSVSASNADAGVEITRTKSNNTNERVLGVTLQGDVAENGLVVSWGDNDPQAKMPTSSQRSYHLSRADWTPAAGPAFSECIEVCADSANLRGRDLSDQAARSAGPGSVRLSFPIRSSGLTPSSGVVGADVCPAEAGPIKGVVVKGGRNPGGEYQLDDAVITHCDATGITISYKHAINTKGTGANNGTTTK